MLGYEDHIYASVGSGIEINGGDADNGERIASFLKNGMRAIDKRIVSCAILYAMAAAVSAAYPLWLLFRDKKGLHALCAALFAPVTFAGLVLIALIAHRTFGLPFSFPGGTDAVVAAVSLLCVTGGSGFLAWLLQVVRFRLPVSALAIPAMLALYLFGASLEGRLYCAPTVDSFAYLVQVDEHVFDEDYEGEVYYDEEKGAIILNGREYPPEQAENEDYLRGAARVGAYAFEALSPWGGNSLFLAREIGSEFVPAFVFVLYAVKAAALAALPLTAGRKRRAENDG